MTVLVTAALGNVGREVARECSELGLAVKVAGRNEVGLKDRFPDMVAARLDFLDRNTWVGALEGCDSVFLLRPPAIGDMATTLCPFIDTAYGAGVTHIAFLSVAGADKKKWVPHHKVELHLQKFGSAWTVLRPGFFAQNLQDAYCRDIVEDSRIYVPAGGGRVAFVDVRDVGEVAGRVLGCPERYRGQALTLTGPEAVTFHQVAALLTAALETPIRYTNASIPGYAWHLRYRRGLSWIQIGVQTVLHVGLGRGDAENVELTVERVLGRPPRSMTEYVRDAVAHWRK
jgi:uncharacterized protein YbjT (DUF2867 family)